VIVYKGKIMPDRFGNMTNEELRALYASRTNNGQNLGALTDQDIQMFYNAGAGVMPEDDYRNWFANSMRNQFGGNRPSNEGMISDQDLGFLNQILGGGILNRGQGAMSDLDANRMGNAIVSGGTNMNPNSLGILGGMFGNAPAARNTIYVPKQGDSKMFGGLADTDYMRFMQNMSGLLR